MTDALRKLIEAVEAGRDDSEKWEPALGLDGFEAMIAFHGRLDSAKALHDSLLPGWSWMKGYEVGGTGREMVTVYLPHEDDTEWKVHIASHEIASRAFLIAILKAKLAEVDSTQPKCPECGDTGLRDSGGVYPWGEYIMVPCDCGANDADT